MCCSHPVLTQALGGWIVLTALDWRIVDERTSPGSTRPFSHLGRCCCVTHTTHWRVARAGHVVIQSDLQTVSALTAD